MTPEETIYRAFAFGSLPLAEAVNNLVAAGYLREDAEDIVDEWADGLEWSAEAHRT